MKKNHARQIVKIKYINMLQTRKRQEQLEIGKIKFEVTPVYVGKTLLTSLFQVKFVANTPSSIIVNSSRTSILKFSLISVLSYSVIIYIYQKLHVLGLLSSTNPDLLPYITPLLFTESLTPYLPMLEQLLTWNNLLTL